jgi:hypothetical protein
MAKLQTRRARLIAATAGVALIAPGLALAASGSTVQAEAAAAVVTPGPSQWEEISHAGTLVSVVTSSPSSLHIQPDPASEGG